MTVLTTIAAWFSFGYCVTSIISKIRSKPKYNYGSVDHYIYQEHWKQ